MYDHPEYLALLANVKANPSDDLPRLVMADWLDEHSEEARAELIRVQCEMKRGDCPTCKGEGSVLVWAQYDPLGADVYPNGYIEPCPRCGEKGTLEERNEQLLEENAWRWADVPMGVDLGWERGFVTQVICTRTQWLGGECGWCRGQGELWDGGWDERETRIVQPEEMTPCPQCGGAGQTAGIGRTLVRNHTVDWVYLSDLHYDDFIICWMGVKIPDQFRVSPELNQTFVGETSVLEHSLQHFNESRKKARAAISAALIRKAAESTE